MNQSDLKDWRTAKENYNKCRIEAKDHYLKLSQKLKELVECIAFQALSEKNQDEVFDRYYRKLRD